MTIITKEMLDEKIALLTARLERFIEQANQEIARANGQIAAYQELRELFDKQHEATSDPDRN